jgi:hypothetical protein
MTSKKTKYRGSKAKTMIYHRRHRRHKDKIKWFC